MECNMPADTRDNDLHDPEFNDAEIGITHNFIDCLRSSPDSLDQAEYAYPSAYHASTTGKGMTTPSPDEEPFPAPPPPLRQPQSPPVVAPIGDSQGYPPSPPFEEAGPTSSVWRAYLHESIINDSDTLRNKRGEVNILLVFAGLFSAVVSNFITTSSDNLQPDYQKMSAFLLFDQVNIQRGLANGISLDDIPTSGADPTIPFLPDPIPLAVNGLWWTSLTLSLVTAFFAILVDAWYCHYVSPIAGQPKVRARIRHLRYRGLIKWRLRAYISFLQLLLHSSLITFLGGLAINSLDGRSFPLAMVLLVIFILSILLYSISSLLAIIHPECPWKTPLSYILSATCKGPPITTIPRLASSLEVKNLSGFNKVQAWEIYAAHKSRIENEVDALRWLYEKSSTSAVHRLVIQALAGLSPDHKACAEEVFSPHWVEIRDEKERMLMDCMELARDGITRWIPKDLPNIDRRIEPLLRLEILFPELCQRLPSGLFGEHNLEFSRKLSNTLLITLSAIDDAHIQKPTEQNQVVMDALADNGVHHPLVWKKLLDRYADKEKLFHDTGDIFTIKMCLNLVTSIYLRKDSPQELCSCTLAEASVTYCKPDILKGLLSFFEAFDLQKDTVDPERRLSLAIVRALAPDSALSTFNSHQRYPFHRDSTISKYQLLRVALHAIQKVLHHHPVDPPSKQWRTDAFWAIVSYMTSDIFIGLSLSNSEDSEFMDLVWTCRAHALVCMASLMHGDPKDSAVEPNAEWATKPLFLNILRVIHDEPVEDAPNLSAIRVFPDLPQRFDSISGVVGFLLGRTFSQGIPETYEAFREKGSLRYIADKSSLHPEFIELLRGYITGLSDAKSGKFPDIQSDEFPDWHIQDLHQAPVIRCICASIARSGTPPLPILSSLASISPHDDKWSNILQTLNSVDDEYSVQCYTLRPTDNGTPDDVERWKKDMKGIVSILTECLEEEKGRNNAINQPLTSSNHITGELDAHHGSGWLSDPNTDVELGVIRIGNGVDAT